MNRNMFSYVATGGNMSTHSYGPRNEKEARESVVEPLAVILEPDFFLAVRDQLRYGDRILVPGGEVEVLFDGAIVRTRLLKAVVDTEAVQPKRRGRPPKSTIHEPAKVA